ncbi:hypothetical protein ACFQO4_02800 [Saliphagus sp. GCM10025334]
MHAEPVTEPEYDVPEEGPALTCPYCARPLQTEELLTYHVGLAHDDVCSDAERETFEEAREDEEFDLFTFHAKAAVSVFLIYFMFVFLYGLVWSG